MRKACNLANSCALNNSEQWFILKFLKNKRYYGQKSLSNSHMNKNKATLNAEKQRKYRQRQKELGHKQVRGYVNTEAMECYSEIREKTGWTDNEVLSNALRITYAAYRCGQIKLLNEWLKDHKR